MAVFGLGLMHSVAADIEDQPKLFDEAKAFLEELEARKKEDPDACVFCG